MPFTGGANIRAAVDLAWADKKLDGFVRNIPLSQSQRWQVGLPYDVRFGG
jgi:hypothetical protein